MPALEDPLEHCSNFYGISFESLDITRDVLHQVHTFSFAKNRSIDDRGAQNILCPRAQR